MEDAKDGIRRVVDAALDAYFEEYQDETERLLANNDQRGFYKHLKGAVGWDGRKAKHKHFIGDKDSMVLRHS